MRRFLPVSVLMALPFVAVAAPVDLKSLYERPLSIPFQGVTAYSPQMATLGKMLFFDPRLSGAQNMSCSSCHNPSFGWEVPVAGAVGAQNVALGRQAPTVLNSAWVPIHFWDGRAPTLEDQARGPVTAAGEMNGNFTEIVERLSAVPEYKTWFAQLFPGVGVSENSIVDAIATYERTIVTAWSPFDRWVEGDDDAISEDAKRGFEVFNTTAGCAACHSGWNFTDNQFHDIGLASTDIGRAKFEPDNPLAMHAFKTPGLRNIMYRGPYMHDGSIETIDEVIAHYEIGVVGRPSLSPMMPVIALSAQDRTNLIEFLKTLTADEADVPTPVLPTR